MISLASIAADASLAVHASSRVRSGQTTDGVVWVASYVGSRASFKAEAMLRRELLTHDQCDALICVAEQSTVWDLVAYAREIA
jgi:hypothetical protein